MHVYSRRTLMTFFAGLLSFMTGKVNAGLISRLSYEDSCRLLQDKGYLESGPIPPMPSRMPQPDDEAPLGVDFFRTFVGDGVDLSNLTLPRTLFNRSEITNARFCNTDLSESFLCWNDFMDVDFTNAQLVRCDLRASTFTRVKFVSADVSQADMRLSSYQDCDFADAIMVGTIFTREQGQQLALSPKQRSDIAWADKQGAEPQGG